MNDPLLRILPRIQSDFPHCVVKVQRDVAHQAYRRSGSDEPTWDQVLEAYEEVLIEYAVIARRN